MTKKLFTTVAASVALIATPVLAQGAAAERDAAPVEQAEQGGGGTDEGTILAILAAIAIAAGIAVALGGDDDTLPTSP
ncbi:hypothetical protein OZN62_05845 [Aurantiacibacter sp. MUD11]|uniref:hypothetical protein n=1 Tax=Aurantiacibacter sp. MUD11 TaxID=3003265 RepID=UPI0022AA1931|nr:hypothetical protein [Aurantiacibacter sp. MUD11]WAT19087.1 hypothetical protein OZN62_05845 [Aurantiacibacter sp. MUD11]